MAPFWRDFFVLSKWIITMADPRRLLWQIACTHVRRLFRDRDVALAEKTQAHIATLPEPSCDSSDRSSEEFSFRRSDLAQHPAPFTGQVCRAGSRGTDTWFTCRPSRDQRNVSSPPGCIDPMRVSSCSDWGDRPPIRGIPSSAQEPARRHFRHCGGAGLAEP